MEKALFIWKEEDLKYLDNSFSRLYFGHEFCETLLPSPAVFRRVLDSAIERGIPFTLVTPYCTDRGVRRSLTLVQILLEKGVKGVEIVFNDFGLLSALKDEFGRERYDLLLGRLLTKQKRGPRILRVMEKAPKEMITHFQYSNMDVPILTAFLKGLGVKRVELDNLLQGVKRKNDLPASLYYPYAYTSTTRMCLLRDCEKEGWNFRRIGTCRLECLKYTFYLTHKDMPLPLILKGNAQFFKREDLPADLEGLKVDRIVHMSGIEE